MSIKKVVKSSVSQQVFDQLREQILSGSWKPGDKLPSENELAAQFGVSRVTVRNALQRLSGLGLLETRFGEGSFIRGPGSGAALNQLVPMLYLGRETLRDILTFRSMVEGPICEIACRRATDREIAGLREQLEQMERAEGDMAAFARLDSAFHGMVARLTRSSMMQQIYQIIDDAMQSAYREHVRRQSVQVALHWYREMLAAFEARDSARARRAMEQALAQTFWISTVYQNVLNMETAWPGRVAVRWYDEAAGCVREVRYRDYAADIRRMVGYLQRNVPGVQGRHIGLLARSGYPYAVALFGCILAGAVAVPLNYEKSWAELSDEVARAGVDCLLADGLYRQREPAFAQYGGRVLDIGAFAGCTELAELAECPDQDALAIILFTSDTAGRSKGVMLSQRNLFAPMRLFTEPFSTVRQQFGLGEDYQFSAFNVLPLFHVAALTSLVSWSISGNAVNFCTDLPRFYRDLAPIPTDVMAVVPTLLKSIHHDVAKGKGARLGKLRIFTCGAATYDPQMLADLIDHGFTIIQTYGLTETVGDGGWNSAPDRGPPGVGGPARSRHGVPPGGRRAVHERGGRHAGLLQRPRGHRRRPAGRVVPHRGPGPHRRGRLYLPDRPQKQPDDPAQRRKRQPRRAGGPAGQDPCRAGGAGAPERRPHLRLYFLPARLPGPGAGFYPCHQPHAAAVQADRGGGIYRSTAAAQRAGQDPEGLTAPLFRPARGPAAQRLQDGKEHYG